MEDHKVVLIISILTSAVVASIIAAPANHVLHAKLTPGSDIVTLLSKKPLAEYSNEITNPPSQNPDSGDVTVLERFYRVYEDGTVEFKLVLSNGVAEFQKITNKEYNGNTIQVYEGYQSLKLPDNTYRTDYYIADENGYRRLRREFDTSPPVLPPYVPHVPKV